MSDSNATGAIPVAEPLPGRAPTEFAGTMDESVTRDIHNLVPQGAKLGNSVLRFMGIALLVLGTPMALLARGYPELVFPALSCLAMGVCFLLGWLLERKGRAHFGRDRVISGRIFGTGIVVEQLGGRIDWDVFERAYLSSSAALLFVRRKQTFGLPLHRSFFESEEAWQEVSQLIREQVRNVTLVADELA